MAVSPPIAERVVKRHALDLPLAVAPPVKRHAPDLRLAVARPIKRRLRGRG